jgi:HSP20 family molecular chaperone IbpA
MDDEVHNNLRSFFTATAGTWDLLSTMNRGFLKPLLGFNEFNPFFPSCNLYQKGSNLVLRAEIGDVDKDDVHLSATDKTITISGEKRCDELENADVFMQQCFCGKFTKTIPLPYRIDPDEVSGDYRDGVLTVTAKGTINKKESRGIKITTSNS